MKKTIDEFIGDDNINWSQHAVSESKKGWLEADTNAFNYFKDLIHPKAQVLDFGCNIGRFYPSIKACGWIYHGIDASATAIKIARQHFGDENLFKWGRGEELHLHYQPDSFDLVFTNTVLQHIHHSNKNTIINNFKKLLKKDGHLVIQEVIDPNNCRTFDRKGWIEYIESFGFKYIISTADNDKRNGFVFRLEDK